MKVNPSKPRWLRGIELLGLISCLAGSIALQGQQLQGRVLHEGTGVADVHVMNLSSDHATISNTEGRFRIRAAVQDTLLFSSLELERKQVVVTLDMLGVITYDFHLEPGVQELEEVVLRPFDLSGNLEFDAVSVKPGEVVTASSLLLPNANARKWTQQERKLNEATTGGGLVPLNPLLNALSGRTRQLKNELALDRKAQRMYRARNLFEDQVFVTDFGIPLEKIDDFLYYCEADPDFQALLERDDPLRFLELVRRKSTSYRQLNGL